MINHPFGAHTIQKLSIGLFLLFSVSGCASQTATLVHPSTGASVKCSASGSGFWAGKPGALMEECFKRYEPQGYVLIENLTPEQRADLERRGALPKNEEAPRGMGY